MKHIEHVASVNSDEWIEHEIMGDPVLKDLIEQREEIYDQVLRAGGMKHLQEVRPYAPGQLRIVSNEIEAYKAASYPDHE